VEDLEKRGSNGKSQLPLYQSFANGRIRAGNSGKSEEYQYPIDTLKLQEVMLGYSDSNKIQVSSAAI